MEAAKNGERTIIQQISRKGVDVVKARNDEGMTALHVAGMYGHKRTINLLIKMGAAIDELDNALDTPVHLAAKYHRSSAMKEFLVHQPMTLKSMVDLINFKNKRGKAVLHLAAANVDAKLLDLLLPIEGIDVNVMTKRKQTPLHLAISNNNEAGGKKIDFCLPKYLEDVQPFYI